MTTEALLLALTLSHTLSRPKLCESIIVVADRLRQLGSMLRDIGMPKEVLQAVGKRRLEVAEIAAGEFGDEEWVLHDLLQCAADHVWELHIYFDDDEWEAAATRAADTAQQLISISSKNTKFYRACHLHYDAISSDMYLWERRAYNKVTQVVNLFLDAVSSTSSSEHVEEMMQVTYAVAIQVEELQQ